MPDKTEKSAAPKVIKWTEEEWASVANHLYEQKGAVLLSSPRLEEIRAKDVFMAQETLPEDRHRKLISIAQGFQGIRDRLSTIFEGMSQVRQDDLFQREQQAALKDSEEAGPAAKREPEDAADPASQKAMPATKPQPQSQPKKQGNRQPQAPDENVMQDAAQDVAVMGPRSAPEEPSRRQAPHQPHQLAAAQPAAPAAAPADENPADQERTAATRQVSQPEQGQRRAEQAALPLGRDRQRERLPDARPQQNAAVATPPSASFIEAARPFVAMVCEEMALALVKVMSGKAGEQQFAGVMQKALAQLTPAGAGGALPRTERQQPQQRQERQPQPFTAPIDNPERAAGDMLDEDGGHPAEVQPLFDPKLPPSANSDFKPTIGLVGANTRELDDLQLLYPQLRLTVVAPDAVRSADVFRQCQRIIGLREDVAQPVDELLRRLLRNRYIRIAGGIPRVREQLNAWLHNPGSINAEPRPHVPRGPKGQGQGQGQGPGQSEGGGKKRHNRHLRAPR